MTRAKLQIGRMPIDAPLPIGAMLDDLRRALAGRSNLRSLPVDQLHRTELVFICRVKLAIGDHLLCDILRVVHDKGMEFTNI